MASIRFDHVHKRFGHNNVIRDANLDIRDKEFLVLVGPSGCGKSTLLRMIAGLEEISEGTLYIDDKPVNHVPPKDRDIAIVFQNYALYPHMTAYDNLAFGLKIRGLNKKVIREKVEEAADILEIRDLLDRKPKAMSGGQRQRVAIGRAMVRHPKVFLFDEPLSNLDAKLRGQMRLEIAKLHRKLNTTVVYVTHDQVEAMTLGERIAVMLEGEILQLDTPQNVYHHPANQFVAGFIGSPPMNFLRGALQSGPDGIYFIDETHSFKTPALHRHALDLLAGESLTMGVRPESISIQPAPGSTSQTSCQVIVLLVERLGHEGYAICQLGDQTLTIRVHLQSGIEPGDAVTIYMDTGKMYFFDPHSGKTL